MVIRLIAILMFFSCSTSLIKDDSSLVKFENAMKYIENSKYSKAIDELEFLLLIDPLSEYSSNAQYFLAESYYNLENYDKAIIEFEKYLSRRSLSNDLLKKTQLYLCKCYYNVTLDYNKDPSSTYIAIEKLQYFIEKESMSENINEIEDMILKLRTKLAKKNFNTAKLYVRLEEFNSATIYYNAVIKEYYDTEFVDDSLINVAVIYFLESKQKSISYLENQKRNFSSNSDYEEAIAFISNLKSKQKVEYYINQLR
tara:strand:+ start:10260 stop:11024 length:765 start_codon:yes stop_codon:yes gene_type:complete